MIFKQPKNLYFIFTLELFERFSFYGLQTILMIYLVKKMSISETDAINVFSSFNAIMYGLVFVGGWIGNKIIGSKRTLELGLYILIIGYTIIFIKHNDIKWIYLGLSIISIGNCLFKPNPSIIVSDIYKKNKKYTPDSGFTIYYMAVNIGSLISIILIPLIAHKYSWNIAFLIPVIGLIGSLIIFKILKNKIKKYGSKIDFYPINKIYLFILLIMISIFSIINYLIIQNIDIANKIINIIITLTIIVFIKEIFFLEKLERRRMIVALILIIEAIIYFVLYNQMPTSLNFFAIKNITPKILGININPEQFQALNPFWIIIFSPILSYIYNKLGKKISITFKFAIGMILCSISFLILPWGIYLEYNKTGIVSPHWLIISYALQSIGELMISGLGLSMITQLVPDKLTGLAISSWFLTTSISSIISGKIANITSITKEMHINTLQSLDIYFYSFLKIGIYSCIISLIMLILSPILDYIIKDNN